MLHHRAEPFRDLSAEFVELSMSPSFVSGARRGRSAEIPIIESARKMAERLFPKGAMLLFVRSFAPCEATR
jgi:hypothetical protein